MRGLELLVELGKNQIAVFWPAVSGDLKELASNITGKPITLDWGPIIGKVKSAEVIEN